MREISPRTNGTTITGMPAVQGSPRDARVQPNDASRRASLSKPVKRRLSSRLVKGTSILKPPNNDGEGLQGILMHPLNILLVCFPLGVLSDRMGWGISKTFWFNFFALVPLAKILGDATEELAAGLKNDMLAGLLNATFGNAVEMVITLQTMRAGLMGVVKATLLGSVLSNLLLVLGMSFFMGGIVSNKKQPRIRRSILVDAQMGARTSFTAGTEIDPSLPIPPDNTMEIVGEKVQSFSAMTALVNTSMLLLSCLSFSLVTVFCSTNEDLTSEEMLLPISRQCSIVIMMAYCAYIFFQLVTHRQAMAEADSPGDGEPEEEEEPKLSTHCAAGLMLVATLIVSLCSELLVASLDGVVEQAGISEHFIGIILLPIIGNACEHASAIRFAIMDKPGLSIGIAVGSSTQVSLFVVPFAVLLGWAIDQPMDLNFGSLNTTVMSVSVIIVLSVVVDGQANWLQGYLLMSAYVLIAMLYWYLPNEKGSAIH
mmetsp:Transcript_47689/g.103724  ORF Transcript_47689/g.103724 Transcript_47689/m.103724 type:complete len:484 (-) Transcript_47689:221-1672(-)